MFNILGCFIVHVGGFSVVCVPDIDLLSFDRCLSVQIAFGCCIEMVGKF